MSKPQAFIAINKSRVKHYPGNEVFLKNDTEFQIELNNPTSHTAAVRLTIGGQVSNSLLVLRPGERHFIDRYVDNTKKLKFESYEIPAENVTSQILKNSDVQVSFFKKKEPRPLRTNWDISWNGINTTTNRRVSIGPVLYGSPWTSLGDHTGNATFTLDPYSTSTAGIASFTCSTTNTANIVKTEEVGLISEGSKSDQDFVSVDIKFETNAFHTETLRLKPVSKTPQTAPTREYCTECGKKLKSSFKFCPACGVNLQ